MNLGPKTRSGDSSSHKCILYSKPTFFHLVLGLVEAPALRLSQGSMWPLRSHIPCSSSLLIFFFAFSFHFPITGSPRLTSLLTLAGLGKNWKLFRWHHYLGVLSHSFRLSLEVALGHKTHETNINGYSDHRCSFLYPSLLWKATDKISYTKDTLQASDCPSGTPGLSHANHFFPPHCFSHSTKVIVPCPLFIRKKTDDHYLRYGFTSPKTHMTWIHWDFRLHWKKGREHIQV